MDKSYEVNPIVVPPKPLLHDIFRKNTGLTHAVYMPKLFLFFNPYSRFKLVESGGFT